LFIALITSCISLSHNGPQQVSDSHINLETSSEKLVKRFTLFSLVIGKLNLVKILFIKSFPDVISLRGHIAGVPFVQPWEYPEAIIKVQENPSQLTAEEVLVERIAYLKGYWQTFHFYYNLR
jgi:hypothetical protein